MRIELKDENREEPQKIDENDLRYKHESDLTKKEKRELERQKLAGMGLGGKLQYIWAYYKPQIFAVVGVIILIFAIRDFYHNAQIKNVLTVSVIDSYGANQEAAEAAVEKELGIDEDPYQIVTVDESLRTDGQSGALEAYSQISFTTKVAAQSLDIVVGPEEFIDEFENKDEYFADLPQLLPEDVYAAFGDQIDQYSITLDSRELEEELETTYEPVKISVLVNTENTENVIKWLTALSEK